MQHFTWHPGGIVPQLFQKIFFGKFFYQSNVFKQVRKFNVLKLYIPYLPFELVSGFKYNRQTWLHIYIWSSYRFNLKNHSKWNIFKFSTISELFAVHINRTLNSGFFKLKIVFSIQKPDCQITCLTALFGVRQQLLQRQIK